VFFEAPHRIRRSLDALTQLLVNRQIFVFREISKIHETLVILPNIDHSAPVPELGEFCVVVSAGSANDQEIAPESDVFALFHRLSSGEAMSRDEAISMVAAFFGKDEKTISKIIKKAKILVDQRTKARS
jgi:16S rRNA (cytidine1402-2'-O)-methyltransferase